MWTDWILAGVIIVVIGAALWYIIREKKRGKKCIGCSYACNCASKGSCHCAKDVKK